MNLYSLRRASVWLPGILWVVGLVLPLAVYASPARQNTPPAVSPPATAAAQLQIETSVTVANQIVTYTLYPTNSARQAAWNVAIRLPLAPNTTLLKSGATPPFITTFDGEAMIFYTPELGPRSTGGPLVVQLALRDAITTPVTIEPEVSWQTLRTILRQSELSSEVAQGGRVAIQPDAVRQAVFDPAGDVPGPGYDLTGVSLEKEGASLKIIFTTAGVLGTTSEASEFYLYLDSDCDGATGKLKGDWGIDYRVRYRHSKAQADISDWLPNAGTAKIGDWGNARSVSVSASTDGTTVTVWVPMIAFQEDRFFCWLAEALRKADVTAPKLPKDELPDFTKDPRLTVYRAWDETTSAFAMESITNTKSYSESSPAELLWAGLHPLGTAVLSPTAVVTGQIAVPLVNAAGKTEVAIWSAVARQVTMTIPNARQPDFHPDGTRLLFNHTGEDGAVVYEYNLADETQTPVSEGVVSALPTYNPGGDRVVYAGVASTVTTSTIAPLYVQCSLALPSSETDENCRKVTELGRLTGDKRWGDIIGSDPLWVAGNQILYRSCPVWDGSRRCGIYTIMANSTFSNTTHGIPVQLADDPSAIPTDAQGAWLTFMAEKAGDWEIYLMAQDGSWLQNLSNNANAQDGLPTFAPNARQVAFVSNRGGQWAVWVVPIQGGDAQKLFDLPEGNFWNPETLSWATERISWGP